jgi:hypothetical protein
VNVRQSQIVTIAVDSGIKLDVASWAPGFGYGGKWWAVHAGDTPQNTINWSSTLDRLLLSPGKYDVYWVQDSEHQNKPMLLVQNVSIEPGKLAAVNVSSGIRLRLSAGAPTLSATGGLWGVVEAGAIPVT